MFFSFKKPLLFFCLFSTLFFLRPHIAFSSNNAPPEYKKGAASAKDEYYLEAIDYFQKGLESSPGHLPSLFALAQSCHAVFEEVNLKYDCALNAYSQVINELENNNAPTWDSIQYSRVLFGQLLLLGGEYQKAIDQLKGFIDLKTDHHALDEVWNSIGVAHYYLDEYQEAVEAFNAALDLNPELSSAIFNVRSVFMRLSIYDKAIAERRDGRLEGSLTQLDHLLSLAPRYLTASLQKALILKELNRPEAAIEEARRALSLGPAPKIAFEFRNLAAEIYVETGNFEPALDEYRQCLKIFPGYMQVIDRINELENLTAPAMTELGEKNSQEIKTPAVISPTSAFPM